MCLHRGKDVSHLRYWQHIFCSIRPPTPRILHFMGFCSMLITPSILTHLRFLSPARFTPWTFASMLFIKAFVTSTHTIHSWLCLQKTLQNKQVFQSMIHINHMIYIIGLLFLILWKMWREFHCYFHCCLNVALEI